MYIHVYYKDLVSHCLFVKCNFIFHSENLYIVRTSENSFLIVYMHVKCSYFMSSHQTCDSLPFHCYFIIFILLYIVRDANFVGNKLMH